MERPFFIPLVSIIAGLSTALLAEWFAPPSIILSLIPAVILTLFLKSRIPFLLAISFLLFFTANLSLKPYLFPDHPRPAITELGSELPFVIEGVVDSRPEPTETGWRITLRVEKIVNEKLVGEEGGRLLLYLREGECDLISGDRIRFSSRIRRPRNYGLPGEFDMERFMAFRNIAATALVRKGEDILFMGDSGQYSVQRQFDRTAMYLSGFISRNVSTNEATVLRALLLGDKGAVPKSIRDAYTRGGVNHILSISGFHVGIIALFVFQIMIMAAKCSEYLLLRHNMRRFCLLSTIPLLIFYLFLSGTAPATIRSVIMIVVYILSVAVDREVDPIDSMMLAAVIIIASSPPALFDLSFQLSFMAIWGIVAITPVLVSPFKGIQGKFAKKMILFFFASVAAISATIIPVAYYFHRTSAIGLISNFLIVPLLGYGAVVIGFSALPFVYMFPFLAKLLLTMAAFLVKTSNAIIIFLAGFPMLPVFTPSQLELGLFFLFMVAFTFTGGGKARAGCCLILALIFAGSTIYRGSPDKGKLAMTFFSVGQGESILVNFPEGKRMLIDGGGSPGEKPWDAGERLLAPALWEMGIDSLDYMVLTHPHPDHIQGLKYVAENFHVGEFWEGRGHPEMEEYRKLTEILRRKGIPVRTINGASAPILIGKSRIEPLAPFPDPPGEMANDNRDMNEESMAFRIICGSFSVLMTGDIGNKVEAVLVRRPDKLRCTVLKIPHHGSRYSSSLEFLRAASPLYAVVSAGYGNSFHLPAEETLAKLKLIGIRLYRTDQDGTVRVIFDETGDNPVIIRKLGHFH